MMFVKEIALMGIGFLIGCSLPEDTHRKIRNKMLKVAKNLKKNYGGKQNGTIKLPKNNVPL